MKMQINIKKKFNIKSIDYISIMIAFVIMIVVFGIASPHFFSINNFLTVIQYCALTGLVALPMTLVMVSGNFDLSLGSIVAFTSCIAGMICPTDSTNIFGIMLSFLAAMAIGAVFGYLNSVFITKVKLSSFIATLATMQAIRGFGYLMTNGKSIMITNTAFGVLGRGKSFGMPNIVFLFAVCIVLFYFIARYTVFGRRLYIIGGNPSAARLSGINVERNVTFIFIILGGMTGLVGVLTASQLGAAIPSSSSNFAFDVITAVVLGGVAISGGKGSIIGSIFGVLLLAILHNGLIMLNVSSHWQLVASGIVLLFAVSIDAVKQRSFEKAK